MVLTVANAAAAVMLTVRILGGAARLLRLLDRDFVLFFLENVKANFQFVTNFDKHDI